MLQTIYRGLTDLGGPAIRLLLARRRAAGKEDADRQPERLGVPSRPRPDGPLVWVHAASVGEALSVLSLVGRLLQAFPDLSILVTTGTVTSARLMSERLPGRAFHQYVPVDRLPWVRRFLDHWRPDLVLWTESELWPNLLSELRRREVPSALINARMSDRSFRRWRRVPRFSRHLLGSFRLCLAQSEAEAERLRRLGGGDVRVLGNLKYSAAPLPVPSAARDRLAPALAGRPAWLLASSHPGEEEIAAEVHAILASRHPGLLTVIAPRHPERGPAIAAMLADRGLAVSRRADDAVPGPADDVYLADTLGELGLLFHGVPIACIGGSLVPFGGHNPIEPAQFGCALLYGPHMENFRAMTDELEAAGAALRVTDGRALAEAVSRLLDDAEERDRLGKAALGVAERNRQAIDRILDALRPLLAEAGIGRP